MSMAAPACAPPERTFTIGMGMSGSSSWAIERQSGTPRPAAAASAVATETPRTAFAPRRSSAGVPSAIRSAASTAA